MSKEKRRKSKTGEVKHAKHVAVLIYSGLDVYGFAFF